MAGDHFGAAVAITSDWLAYSGFIARHVENIIRDLEREHILETLAAAGGSRKLAGERLGMSERTLRHKLKQYREAGLFEG